MIFTQILCPSPEIPSQYAWGGSHEFPCLTTFQVMLILLFWKHLSAHKAWSLPLSHVLFQSHLNCNFLHNPTYSFLGELAF